MKTRALAAAISLLLIISFVLAVPWYVLIAAAAGQAGEDGMVRVDGTRFVVGDGDRTV
jgi:hypothetical protein